MKNRIGLKCPLTLTQLRVLQAAAWYGTNSEGLSAELELSKHTINNHFSHINQLLECPSRADSVLLSLRKGWIELMPERTSQRQSTKKASYAQAA
jgi:DNA-binding NarL/FixJ family response regulator